jgi:Sulfotransferase domain
LVVKTHEWGPDAEQKFQKVILLVRDPAKAIVAEFNRQSGGHVGHASQDRYKRTKGKCERILTSFYPIYLTLFTLSFADWTQFVTNKLWAWEETNLAWGLKFHGPKKIIFYDHLVEKVEQTIREMLQFLEFPIDEVRPSLNALSKTVESKFQCMSIPGTASMRHGTQRGNLSSQEATTALRSVHTGHASGY